jgi:hypothetical protein
MIILASGVLVRTVACPVPEQPGPGSAEHATEPLARRSFPSANWSCGGSPSAAQS